jgi:hypothetical protein
MVSAWTVQVAKAMSTPIALAIGRFMMLSLVRRGTMNTATE